MSTYVFSPAWEQERERLAALSTLLDPTTTRILSSIGVSGGWRCLEVGAGSGSIAKWFAEKAGPAGHALATDLTVSFMDGLARDNIEIRQHDLMADPLEEGTFDVAHARFVLEYIPEPEMAIQHMISAVRPGGWVVIEDINVTPSVIDAFNCFVFPQEEAGLHRRLENAISTLYQTIGADPGWGLRIPLSLSNSGLENLHVEIHTPFFGGAMNQDFPRLTVQHLQERLISAGLLTEDEVAHYLTLANENTLGYAMFQVVSGWGQRPA